MTSFDWIASTAVVAAGFMLVAWTRLAMVHADEQLRSFLGHGRDHFAD